MLALLAGYVLSVGPAEAVAVKAGVYWFNWFGTFPVWPAFTINTIYAPVFWIAGRIGAEDALSVYIEWCGSIVL